MAHKMVRQPSETPNINNIDDIIPFRYAYGNQDGYVINKGTELSYTINGNEFRINSGRVVLQGIEDDIDANGVTVTIDNISGVRYYVVYYRVNLATNTTSYEITYDTAGYPIIDKGDDLTKNSSGIANLPLYRFKASSGVISNVEKVVKAVEYINKNITVENSKNINDLPIKRDENGVLKIGNIVIPQKKVLWSGEEEISSSNLPTITLNEKIYLGDTIRIKTRGKLFDFTVVTTEADWPIGISDFGFNPATSSSNKSSVTFYDLTFYGLCDNSNTLTFSSVGKMHTMTLPYGNEENVKTSGSPSSITFKITEISKIIE